MRQYLVRTSVLALGLAAFGGGPTAASGAATAAIYRVDDLGTLPGDYASVAMGINQFGDVVGWSLGPSGTRAFLYTAATGMTALPAPAGRPVATARDVNASRTVVGYASPGGSDIGRAARWQSGTALDLGALGTGLFSDARSVNATGTTVGWSYTDGGSLLGIHAFRHDAATGLVDLTPTADHAQAEAINDAGQIAGWRDGRAFRLAGTTFTDLGVPAPFAQSFGVAINGSGQVAGHVITGSGNEEKIFRYTDGTGLVILGGVGELNRANGINTAGDVVGRGRPVAGLKQGFLFTDSNGMQGLNQLIDPAAGWFVLGAGDINDAGQIAGWASGPLGQHAVRLTPTGSGPPQAPTGTITAPAAGTRYAAGTQVSYAGSATDPESGTLPPSAFTWRVDFHHADQVHPFVPSTSGSRTGSFTIPNTGETATNVWYRVTLTVRDPGGLTHASFRDLQPRVVTIRLETTPSALKVALDGQPRTAPYTFASVVGMRRTLAAVTPQAMMTGRWAFSTWSDGGAASHLIVTPGLAKTYRATYVRG